MTHKVTVVYVGVYDSRDYCCLLHTCKTYNPDYFSVGPLVQLR